MEIRDKTILLLGGYGLVGMAIAKKLLKEEPREVIICSLLKEESEKAIKELRKVNANNTRLSSVWGNVFVRESLKDMPHSKMIDDEKVRKMLLDDVIYDLNEDILNNSFLYRLIHDNRPHIIIDCINSATALAYQDVYFSGLNTIRQLNIAKKDNSKVAGLFDSVEKLLCTQYIPQLIRHIQILYEATRRSKTHVYLKIGTSGTGGMGLNIPYTHSEERPSRVLLSKSSVAGAHSMLLFLMARTPDAPIIKEIKPTAAIAWKKIAYGEIKKKGQPVELEDCLPENGYDITDSFSLFPEKKWTSAKGKKLKSVYIDTGENGLFSRGEFMTITAIGQMGFVTPEEIAKNSVYEIKGGNTGNDIMNALDNTTMGPTYRAGSMRHSALQKMSKLEKENNVSSVAFEFLGPPRLSKLLFEAYLLRKTLGTFKKIKNTSSRKMTEIVEKYIKENEEIRSQIISIGIGILLSDGKTLLRANTLKIPPFRGEDDFTTSEDNLNQWTHDGWVDLRPSNMMHWKERISQIIANIDSIDEDDSSSQYEWDRYFWLEDEKIDIGKVVGWIFVNEDKGLRMKS